MPGIRHPQIANGDVSPGTTPITKNLAPKDRQVRLPTTANQRDLQGPTTSCVLDVFLAVPDC